MKESITVDCDLIPVHPVRPPAGYIGGKRNLSKRLVAMIDATEHALYAEPYVGMGGVFFRRTRRPRAEAINDISGDVATLFRILQRHYQAFMDMLKWRFASRAEFERLMAVDPVTCTDLERAARFLFLQRLGFGGQVVNRTYGVRYTGPTMFRFSDLEVQLRAVHERLEAVNIERLAYGTFVRRYDRSGALFYLDPPYHGCEGDYGDAVFSEADYRTLSDLLAAIEGRFILSINDTPMIRDLFGRFAIEPVEVSYSVSGKPTRAGELIITGSA